MSNTPTPPRRQTAPVKQRNFEYDYRHMTMDEVIEVAQRAGFSLRRWQLTRHLKATLRYNGYQLVQ